ncbi:MAG: hypothetical protein GY906_40095 [bacterium]|nr:hypothetical protein [bacterium]
MLRVLQEGDVEQLVGHFAQSSSTVHGTAVNEIPADLMRRLDTYSWPGNVRELQNIVERAVLASNDGVLRLTEPLEAVLSQSSEPTNTRRLATLEEVEKVHIEAVLATCDGQIAGKGGAAQILGMHPNTLRSRIKKLGISTRNGNA